ncbi:STAS domain-containing protein [Atopobium fossor]|uniref:STAS domain-containing protein n=1 Tax=Atopobium fossor TaxID=39487 RepID=UPI0003FB29A9|nr:STAS domain-containing protein [Atopobium fossor]
MDLLVTTQTTATGITLMVSGEVDVSCADELRNALFAALESKPAQIIVDLSEVSYIDSTGIGVLVGVAHKAAEQNGILSVIHPQKNVARVLSLLGVDSELNVVLD